MPKFQVVSDYQPSGDQPQAINALAEGFENGLKEQILLGVTGSGKTFTMAKVIEKVQRPTLVLVHPHNTVQITPAYCLWAAYTHFCDGVQHSNTP